MAENELLDLSNPYVYRRWQQLLATQQAKPSEAADALYEDFSRALRKAMRQEPMSRVFEACGKDRAALQVAVSTCKDRSLAKLIEQACKIERSGDPIAVARALADLMIDSLTDQCNRRSYSLLPSLTRDGQQEMESATVQRLEKARPDIVSWLGAALRGDVSDLPKTVRLRRQPIDELLKTSLVNFSGLVKRSSDHV